MAEETFIDNLIRQGVELTKERNEARRRIAELEAQLAERDAQCAEMRAENLRLQTNADIDEADRIKMESERDQARAEAEAAVNTFNEYGSHVYYCNNLKYGGKDCNCGFYHARAKIKDGTAAKALLDEHERQLQELNDAHAELHAQRDLETEKLEAACVEMRRAANAVLDWASGAHLPKPEPEAIMELRKAVVFVDAGKALHVELEKLRAVAEASKDVYRLTERFTVEHERLRQALDALKENP